MESAHGSVTAMLERTRAAGEETTFDRMTAQGAKRCGFCEQGVRCSLCSQGPCRITPKAPRGVCGIDADGMAMRGLLLQNTMGAAAYTYHAGEVMKTLAQAKPGGTYEIKDWSKLELLASAARVALEPRDTLPKRVADAVWQEFNRDHQSASPLVEAFAPKERVALWKELGIMPGGVLHEHVRATTSSMTNIDGDYVSLALKALRLGLATAYGAQVPLELAQDALWGTPSPHAIKVDLGILDGTYVNIVVNGHEPMLGAALIDAAHDEAAQARARAVGAQGPAHRRLHRDRPGARTALRRRRRLRRPHRQLAEPGAGRGDRRHRRVRRRHELHRAAARRDVQGARHAADPGERPGRRRRAPSRAVMFDPAKAGEQAQELIARAIANFPQARGARGDGAPALRTGDAVAGFSTESILGALGGSLDPLLDVIKDGTLKGVAGLVSCTTLRDAARTRTPSRSPRS